MNKAARAAYGSSRRTRLTVAQKIEVINEIKRSMPYSSIAEKFKIGIRTIAGIRREDPSILKAYGSYQSQKKGLSRSSYDVVEVRVLRALEKIRKSKMHITVQVMQAYAWKKSQEI